MTKQFFTINEAAKLLGVSIKTLRRWETKGLLTPIRTIGNQRRYEVDAIYALTGKKSKTATRKEAFKQTKQLSLSQSALHLGISEKTLRRWEKKGIISSLRNGANQKMFLFKDLESLKETKDTHQPNQTDTSSVISRNEMTRDLVEISHSVQNDNSNKFRFSPEFVHFPTRFALITIGLFASIVVIGGFGGFLAITKLPIQTLISHLPFNTKYQIQDTIYQNKVLQAATQARDFALRINVPIEMLQTASVAGNLTAPNILYSVVAGDNITVTGDPQNPIISANASGVTSLGGETGALALTAGTGIGIDGLTITNDDPGSGQNIFKNVKVSSNTIAAGSNTDTLEFVAGSNISLSTDTSDKKITISSSGFSPSGLTTNGVLYADSATSFVSLAPSTAGYVLTTNGSGSPPTWEVNSAITPTFDVIESGTNTTATMVVGTGASLNFSGSGTINASSLNGATFAAPGAIGGTTPGSGAFTSLSGTTIAASGLISANAGLTVANGQNTTLASFTSNNNSVLYTNASGVINAVTTTGTGLCLIANGANAAPSWGSCSDAANWFITDGAISPEHTSLDFLLGATATSSAKFAVTNINSGTPTASLSGGMYFTGAGELRTTNNQSLTIGGGDTGDIVISGLGTGIVQATNGVLSASAIDLTSDVSGILPLTNGGTNASLTANNGGIVWSDADSFEILSANANTGLALISGGAGSPSWFTPTQGSLIFAGANGALSQDNTNLFFDDNTNRLGIGTTNPLATLDVNGTASFSGVITFANGASSIQGSNNNTLTLGGDTTGNIVLRPLDGQAGSNLTILSQEATLSTTTTLNATALTTINTAALSLNTTGALTLDSSDDIVVDADGADIFFRDGGATFVTFTNSGTDLLIDVTGNNLILADGVTLNVGNGGAAAYNSFADAYSNVDIVDGDADLFIGDELEVNGNARFDGSTITFSAFANCTALTTSSGNIGCSTTELGSTWDIVNGTIVPKTASVVDLLIGGTASSSARFHAYGSVNAGTTPSASVAASSTFAGFVLDNSVGDIFAASSSGQTRLALSNNGELRFYDADQSNYTGFKTPTNITSNALYTFPAGLPVANDYVLISQADGTLSWGNAGELPFVNYWDQASGAMYPKNAEVYDLLLGSTATASAEFAITGIATGAPIASLSASTNGYGISLNASGGTLQSLNFGTLTLGGDTTGTIALRPNNSNGTVAFNVNNLTINGQAGATSPSLTCVSVEDGIVVGFGGCGAGAGGSKWSLGEPSGVLYPQNPTVDLLIGGSSTASAKFGVLNVAGGTPTASLSAITTDNALTLDAQGIIGTTNKQTLTLGNASTGDINLIIGGSNELRINGVAGADVSANCVNVSNGIVTGSATCPAVAANFIWQEGFGTIFEGNVTQDLLIGGVATSSARFHAYGSTNAGTTPSASISANSTFAGLVVDNSGSGDIFTASSSGMNRFVIKQNGNIGIGTTIPTATLDVNALGNAASITSAAFRSSPASGIGSGNQLILDNLTGTGTFKNQISFRSAGSERWSLGNDGSGNGLQTFFIHDAIAGATRLYIDAQGKFGLNTGGSSTPPRATLDLRATTATNPIASISGSTNAGFAGLVVDNSGSGDIFTASSSGQTRFTINQNGTLILPVYAGANSVLYVDATTGVLTPLTTASVNQCLISGSSVPSWTSCAAAGSNWDIQNGIITPKLSSTLDFLLGSPSSGSAKFAVLNVDGSASPVASVSATTASGGSGSGIALGGNGTIQSLRNASLTLGGDTTGNIVLNPRNGTTGGFVGPATDNVTDLGASPSARFRSIYLGPGSLHVQCTTGDGCAQGTDYAFGINTTTGDLQIGINGTGSNANAKIRLGQDGTTTFTGDAVSTNGTAYAALGDDGNIFASDGTNLSGLYGGGNLELARSSNDAFIDLKTNDAEDYDVRLEATSDGFGVRTGSSGSRSFLVDSTGNLYLYNYNCTANSNSGALTVDGTGLVGCSDDDGGAGGGEVWQAANGVISQKITTQDLLIGGVSSTSARFHVYGSANASATPVATISGNTSQTAFVVDNQGSGGLFAANSNGLSRFMINQAGNIGIGTATPTEAHVVINNALNAEDAGSTNLSLLLHNTSNTAGQGPGIGFENSGGTGHVGAKINFIRTGSNSQGNLAFYIKGDTASGDTTSKVLQLSATSGSPTATISANTSSDGLTVDNRGSGNLFQALSNGLSRFTISQTGNLTMGTTTSGGNRGLTIYSQDNAYLLLNGDTDNDASEIGSAYVGFTVDGTGTPRGLLGVIQTAGQDPSGSSYTNTGSNSLFLGTNGTNDLQFGVNGAVAMHVESSTGYVGIGSTTTSELLTITGGAIGGDTAFLPLYTDWNEYGTGDGGAGIYNDNGTYDRLMIVGNNNLGGVRRVGLWDYVSIDGALYVGGTADAGYYLDVRQSTGSYLGNFQNSNGSGLGVRVQIRTTGTPGRFMSFQSLSGASDYENGWIIGSGGGACYCSASDIRLKENIVDTHYGIDDLMKVQVADFNYIKYPDETTTGFLAQQLYSIFPPAVNVGTSGNDTSVTWGVDYGKITPLIIKGVQDQQRQLESLKASVSAVIAGSITTNSLTVNNLQTQTLSLGGQDLNNRLLGLETGFASTSASFTTPLATQLASLSGQITSLSDKVASLEAQISLISQLSPIGGFNASSSADLSLQSLEVNGNILTDSLNVLGYTTMNELSVTGSIRTGVLTINGQTSGGASISTLNGDLKLQDQGFGGIDILDGLVTIDTDGNIETQGTITAKKFNVDTTSVSGASAGQIIIPIGVTSYDINTTALTPDSLIFVTPNKAVVVGAEPKDANTFTIRLQSAQIIPIKVNWWIVN